MPKYIIFEVAGDPMKDLAATAVVANLKRKYPEREIVVSTLWPEIWLHHPDIYRVYKLGATSYFYDDFIKDRNSLIFRLDPYLEEDFIYRRRHLIEIWSDLVGTKCEIKKPIIHFTAREIEATGKMIDRGMPLFIFETRALLNKPLFDFWKTAPEIESVDFPSMMAIINAAQKEGLFPLHIKRTDEPNLPGIDWINLPLRQLLYAVGLGKATLFLNSFALQATAGLNVSANVLSSENDWKVWGYDDKNIRRLQNGSVAEIIEQIFP